MLQTRGYLNCYDTLLFSLVSYPWVCFFPITDGHKDNINDNIIHMEKYNIMIRYLVMDVDGTLTDGKIYISPSGEAMKAFNIKDGYGIHDLLLPTGIIPVIITGRSSDIVLNRCHELGIKQVYQGIGDKLSKLKEIAERLNEVAYIGDDINDFPCMEAVKTAGGVIGCPADATESVKRLANYKATHKGGDGAVRDFIEWITAQRI